MWWFVALAAASGFAVSFAPHEEFSWMLLNLVWLDVSFMIALAVHELSHAIAARAVGFRLFRVVIGAGKTWRRGKLWGFDVELKIYPFSGVTIAAPRELQQTTWNHFFFTLAGPLANACLLGLAFLAKGKIWETFHSSTFNGWFVFAVANCITLLANLWPHISQTELGPLPSDGSLLLRYVIGKPPHTPEDAHASWFRLEAATCSEQRQNAEARSWLERGLATYPQNWLLRDAYCVSMMCAGEFQKARSISISLLADLPAEDPRRLIIFNNIAYADAILEDPALLEEADRYSAEALAAVPWSPALQNTRGVVLLALNRLNEALPLLRDSARAPERTPESYAECLCWLAIAEARQGDVASAERNIAIAKQADPGCQLLPRAQAALQTVTSQKPESLGTAKHCHVEA